MPLNHTRLGISLIELLVVLLIIGAVSSVALFALKRSSVASPPLTLNTLKTVLLNSSEGSRATLVCAADCQTCEIRLETSGKKLPFTLQNEGEVLRYAFDRNGDLRPIGHPIIANTDGFEEGCFSMSVSSDGIISPLILKNGQTFFAYTPLGGDAPTVSRSEESIRDLFYDEALMPQRSGSYYGAP